VAEFHSRADAARSSEPSLTRAPRLSRTTHLPCHANRALTLCCKAKATRDEAHAQRSLESGCRAKQRTFVDTSVAVVQNHGFTLSRQPSADTLLQGESNSRRDTRSTGASRPNFALKLVRPGVGPPAEPAAFSPAPRRHAGGSSPLGSANVIGGNRRAASASARGTGRTA
jgi:hypothetical protein